ncbi:unnamed protein product [Gordionus sp. m RMFG-2023]|uniref:uncharacterized protein LOC135922971 isoform X2 n=1 Tax=Gordionus sp. m RMFG-2023 TaxID=3053472 RepID=UPI0030DE4399
MPKDSNKYKPNSFRSHNIKPYNYSSQTIVSSVKDKIYSYIPNWFRTNLPEDINLMHEKQFIKDSDIQSLLSEEDENYNIEDEAEFLNIKIQRKNQNKPNGIINNIYQNHSPLKNIKNLEDSFSDYKDANESHNFSPKYLDNTNSNNLDNKIEIAKFNKIQMKKKKALVSKYSENDTDSSEEMDDHGESKKHSQNSLKLDTDKSQCANLFSNNHLSIFNKNNSELFTNKFKDKDLSSTILLNSTSNLINPQNLNQPSGSLTIYNQNRTSYGGPSSLYRKQRLSVHTPYQISNYKKPNAKQFLPTGGLSDTAQKIMSMLGQIADQNNINLEPSTSFNTNSSEIPITLSEIDNKSHSYLPSQYLQSNLSIDKQKIIQTPYTNSPLFFKPSKSSFIKMNTAETSRISNISSTLAERSNSNKLENSQFLEKTIRLKSRLGPPITNLNLGKSPYSFINRHLTASPYQKKGDHSSISFLKSESHLQDFKKLFKNEYPVPTNIDLNKQELTGRTPQTGDMAPIVKIDVTEMDNLPNFTFLMPTTPKIFIGKKREDLIQKSHISDSLHKHSKHKPYTKPHVNHGKDHESFKDPINNKIDKLLSEATVLTRTISSEPSPFKQGSCLDFLKSDKMSPTNFESKQNISHTSSISEITKVTEAPFIFNNDNLDKWMCLSCWVKNLPSSLKCICCGTANASPKANRSFNKLDTQDSANVEKVPKPEEISKVDTFSKKLDLRNTTCSICSHKNKPFSNLCDMCQTPLFAIKEPLSCTTSKVSLPPLTIITPLTISLKPSTSAITSQIIVFPSIAATNKLIDTNQNKPLFSSLPTTVTFASTFDSHDHPSPVSTVSFKFGVGEDITMKSNVPSTSSFASLSSQYTIPRSNIQNNIPSITSKSLATSPTSFISPFTFGKVSSSVPITSFSIGFEPTIQQSSSLNFPIIQNKTSDISAVLTFSTNSLPPPQASTFLNVSPAFAITILSASPIIPSTFVGSPMNLTNSSYEENLNDSSKLLALPHYGLTSNNISFPVIKSRPSIETVYTKPSIFSSFNFQQTSTSLPFGISTSQTPISAATVNTIFPTFSFLTTSAPINISTTPSSNLVQNSSSFAGFSFPSKPLLADSTLTFPVAFTSNNIVTSTNKRANEDSDDSKPKKTLDFSYGVQPSLSQTTTFGSQPTSFLSQSANGFTFGNFKPSVSSMFKTPAPTNQIPGGSGFNFTPSFNFGAAQTNPTIPMNSFGDTISSASQLFSFNTNDQNKPASNILSSGPGIFSFGATNQVKQLSSNTPSINFGQSLSTNQINIAPPLPISFSNTVPSVFNFSAQPSSDTNPLNIMSGGFALGTTAQTGQRRIKKPIRRLR